MAGSNVSNDIGPPAFGSGGFTPPISPKSIRIGWWPRRNDFQAQRASPEPGAKWSVSAITTFLPSAAGGSAYQADAGISGFPGNQPGSSNPGEIHSARLFQSGSFTFV